MRATIGGQASGGLGLSLPLLGQDLRLEFGCGVLRVPEGGLPLRRFRLGPENLLPRLRANAFAIRAQCLPRLLAGSPLCANMT